MARAIRQGLVRDGADLTYDRVRARVWEQTRMLTSAEQADVLARVWADLTGAGPLQELLATPGTTDVLVNGPNDVWWDRGNGLEKANIDIGADSDVRTLAMRLAAAAGCRLDDAVPHADGRLPGGVRLHAMLHPLVDSGAVISLRIPRSEPWTLADLTARGMMPRQWEVLLGRCVAEKMGIIVSGATGSGKSTLLGALLQQVPTNERIVLIEESKEIDVAHPHVVRLQARRANAEGVGEVSMQQLVKEALRMRPDRIAVGEVRGAELREMLIAFNTGHPGGIGTLHANTAADVAARLVSLGLMCGLPPRVLANQAASALDLVVHVSRVDVGGSVERRVTDIAMLVLAPNRDDLLIEPVAQWDGRNQFRPRDGWGPLAARVGAVPHRSDRAR
ncbi:TadA family conjugal transfer-associated ATPase [Rarobacter incanus]